jgi:signal transduction histidine kinase
MTWKMQPTGRSQRWTHIRPSSTAVVVGVLIASVAVASVLAFQAISAARSRQAVSEAMLRQYAELAAWEFSREARKDLDAALNHVLSRDAHPKNRGHCDCASLTAIDHTFQFTTDGGVEGRATAIPADLAALIAPHMSGALVGSMEGGVQIRPIGAGGARFAAFRWEPHVGASGGQIGLIAETAALVPVLERTYRRANVLPQVLADGQDTRSLVDLRIVDAAGRSLFASPGTVPGPQKSESELLPGQGANLRLLASMTPAFVASLGPEHGAGPNGTLVVGLVIVNVLMVAVGLWQLARERELARLRADFVAGVSHELRTPLAQIRLFTDTLLLDRIRNPGEGRRALEIIAQETRRLSQLVENVLYFHRHQRAPEAPPREPVDLTRLVMEVAEGFKPLAASRRIGISVRTPVGAVMVEANADAVRQVLLNLLDNAVKFGPADATIAVSLETPNDMARIAVEDSGEGVPLADRRRIFDQFERGRTGGAGGAGIGLSVVQQIVHAHEGEVSVEDSAGGGARFVVLLPLSDFEDADVLAAEQAG